jgi:glycosyltransferase involved in cell wall biosynthesis
MHIAVLSLHLPSPARVKTGGVAYVAHRLANALICRDHYVTVFSTDAAPAGAAYRVVTIPATASSSAPHNWLQNWQIARRFGAEDFRNFDVIHTHGDDAFLWKPGPPVVRTLHGAALAEAIHAPAVRRKLWYLTFAPRETWEAAKADITVAVSESTRRYIPFIDFVIPNPVDLSIFHPGTESVRAPAILFVGTLGGRKRGQMLVDTFLSHVRPAVPNAELWLVADRPLDAPGVVSFLQPDESALADLYRRASIFCLPSRYEGFGIPYIEAMASGTPVVATPNPGANEVLGNGSWGVIAPAAHLGETLVSLLQDAEARWRWSVLGLQRAADFKLDTVVDAYESLFRDVIQHHRR